MPFPGNPIDWMIPSLRFGHARRRVADPRLAADRLCHERSEPVEVDDVVVLPREGA
jgi:hypothetical protein